MKHLRYILVGLVIIGSTLGLWVAGSKGQAPGTINLPFNFPINVYSAKFLCGALPPTPQGQIEHGPVKPGNYQTAINVHNPNFQPVTFVKKAILMYATDATFQQGFEIPRPPGQLVQATLEPDFGLEIDCADIRQVLLKGMTLPTSNAFIKGFVVIETPGKVTLDVVSAYTAHGFKVDLATGSVSPEGFAVELDKATFTTVPKPTGKDKDKDSTK
jgi:hypothetical protein